MVGRRVFHLHKWVYGFSLMGTCALFAIIYTKTDLWPDVGTISHSINTQTVYRKDLDTGRSRPTGSLACGEKPTVSNNRPDFQAVETSATVVYAYSALAAEDSVIIIALKKRGAAVRGLYCALWSSHSERSTSHGVHSQWRVSTVNASIRDLHEHHDLEYTAAYIVCPIQTSHAASGSAEDGTSPAGDTAAASIPNMVGLVTNPTGPPQPKAELSVQVTGGRCSYREANSEAADNNKRDRLAETGSAAAALERDVEFTVCGPVLHSGYRDAAQLVEKLEMSRLLGAGRVVLYNHSASAHMDTVLRVYSREWAAGRDTLEVAVHSWRLPSQFSNDKLYQWGQLAAINDCLYRYRHRTKFIVFSDLDQHVIPRRHTTWADFTNHYRGIHPGLSGFSFRTTIFRKEWTSPAKGLGAAAAEYRSAALGHTEREDCVSPDDARTRVIVDPKRVTEMGAEKAWGFSGTVFNVSEQDGLVHQYSKGLAKDSLSQVEQEKCSMPVEDVYAVNTFGVRLAAWLKKVWSKLPDLKEEDLETQGKSEKVAQRQPAKPSENRLPVRPERFRLAEGLTSPVFVYSALWRNDSVRLVVIKVQGFEFTKLHCVFLQGSSRLDVKATVKDFHQFKASHTSAFITCPVTPKNNIKDTFPLSVGLVEERDKSSRPKVSFPVESREMHAEQRVINRDKTLGGDPRKETKVEFTVCIPAMFQYGNAAQLVEKLEMSRILGAGRVVMYNHSVGANVDAVLRMYTSAWAAGKDTLEVVVHPWRLPSSSGKIVSVPYYAQLASIDDCLHRYRWTTQFTEFSDMDEYIIPLRHATWGQLLADRDDRKPGSAGFMFRSTVFSRDNPHPAKGFEQAALQYGSSVLGYTQRDNYVFHRGVRSKLIVRPSLMEEMGVHYLWEASGPTDIVPLDDALLFHYRKAVHRCMNQTIDTRAADKFGKRLAVRLEQVWSQLKGVSLGVPKVTTSNKDDCK